MSVAEAPTVEEVVPVKPKRVRAPRKPKAQVAPATPPEVVEPKRDEPVSPPQEEVKPKAEPPVKPKRQRVPHKKAEKPAENELVPTVDPGDPLSLLSKLPAVVVGDLSTDQRHARYDYLKAVVSASLGSFVLIGRALDEIREQEYWKLDRYPTWDEFVQSEWDLGGKQRASQLILASRTFFALKDYLDAKGVDIPLPSVESHLVPLQRLDSVEAQANAWQAAYATAERKTGDRLRLTADHIDKVVQEHLGFKSLPDTGPGTNNPTPPEKPPAPDPVPPTKEEPEDTVPPEDAAPQDGQPVDQLDGFVPDLEQAEIVNTGGKPKTLTPTVALQYLIKALKGGYLSHRDPLVVTLVEVVQEGLIAWSETPSDDTVEIDYDEGAVPEITVEYPEEGGEEDLDLEDEDEDEDEDDQA